MNSIVDCIHTWESGSYKPEDVLPTKTENSIAVGWFTENPYNTFRAEMGYVDFKNYKMTLNASLLIGIDNLPQKEYRASISILNSGETSDRHLVLKRIIEQLAVDIKQAFLDIDN